MSPLLWSHGVIAVGREKGKSLAQRPAHTSVSTEFRLRPQDRATSSHVLKTSQDRDLTASLGPCSSARLATLWLFFSFFHIRISPFSDYNRCCFTHNQTQSDFLSIRYVKLKKRIHNLVSFIKALVGHSAELWSLSHLGMGLGTLGKSGLSFCSLQVKFRTLDHKSLTEDYLDMGCMQITLHSGSFKKLLLQRANKEKGLT